MCKIHPRDTQLASDVSLCRIMVHGLCQDLLTGWSVSGGCRLGGWLDGHWKDARDRFGALCSVQMGSVLCLVQRIRQFEFGVQKPGDEIRFWGVEQGGTSPS